MITRENYDKLKKQFGHVASWAIWTVPGETPKSNTSDMSLFADEDALCQKLNPNYVFVGLNASIHTHKEVGLWSNFHSDDNKRQNDYKLRFALMGTHFWGSYITDVIKEHPDPIGKNVVQFMRKNPDKHAEHIKNFKEEMALLGTKPTLIAMGNDAFEMLEPLKNEFTIIKIPHYAAQGALQSQQNYKTAVIAVLENI